MHLVRYHVLFIVLLDSLVNSNSNLDKIMLLMPSFSASLTHVMVTYFLVPASPPFFRELV
jgi:hypothetical protein